MADDTNRPARRSYRDSRAYQRSHRMRPDGTPVWPLRQGVDVLLGLETANG